MLNNFITAMTFDLPGFPYDIAKQTAITGISYDPSHFGIHFFESSGIPLSDSILKSVNKRQAEYFTGRLAARHCLDRLGFFDFNVFSGKHRNPIWPKGISASITHANNSAICIATFSREYQYVGIDLEKVIRIDVIEKIANSIAQPQELKFLNSLNMDYNLAFTIAFSSKESLFKALYPSIGKYFEFSAARITSICEESQMFALSLTQNLTQNLIAGMIFTGFFSFTEQTVTTVLVQKIG